ncbi:MAG: hypothetical protein Fur0027_15350 [Raineya sp.]
MRNFTKLLALKLALFLNFTSQAIPPNLVSTNPADGAINVATNANVLLAFDINIRKGTGNITLTPSPSGTPIVVAVTSPTVTIIGGNTLRIAGLTMLQNTVYEVTMPSGVVEEDTAPNDPFAGIASGDYSFRTVAPAPVLSSFTPTHNSTGNSLTTNLVMNFDQNMDKGTGNIVITPILPAGVPTNVDVNSTNVTVSGSTVTVTGLSLNENTRYEVTMASGVLTGLAPASTPFAGIAVNTWLFVTISPAPTLTATAPAHLAINVVTSPTLTLTFDRNVAKGTGNIVITPILPAGAPININVTNPSVSVSGNVVSITSPALNNNTTYQVTMASGVFTATTPDPTPFAGITAGNWEFTTLGNASITAPTLDNLCRGSNVYLPLGNIVINEGSRDNFEAGASQLLILNAPTDYEFQTGTGSVAATGDVSINSFFIGATKIFIIYTSAPTYNTIDNITISGLQVKANASAAASGTVLRDVASSANIVGVTGASVFATFNSVALPAQPILLAGTDTDFCVGENITSATFPITSAAGFNYEWYADAALSTLLITKIGTAAATAAELGISTAAVNTYNRYVVRVNTTTGCKSTPLHVVIQIYANPAVNMVSNEPDNAICQGEKQVTFTAFGSATSYQFYVNGNPVTPAFGTVNPITGGAELVTNLALAAGTYSVYVVGTSNGCTTQSGTINFVVHNTPTVTYSPPTTTFFTSQTSGVALTGGSPAGGTYSGAGVVSNTFYPNLIPGPYPATTTITYTYTNANGCSGSDVSTVTVDESVTPIVGLGATMCQNDAPLVVAINPILPNYSPTPVGATPYVLFLCTVADNKYKIEVLSGNPAVLQYSSGQYTINPSLAGTYPMNITFRVFTCFNGFYSEYTQSTNILPSPTATISNVSNGQQFCSSNPNLTVSFNVSGGSGGGSGVVSIRQLPGGSFSPLTGNTINFTSLTAGASYELRLVYTDGAGCSSTDLKNFNIYPNPIPDFTILPTSVLCQGAVDLYLDPTPTRDPSHPDFGTNPPATFINNKGYFAIYNSSGTSLLAVYANGDNHLSPAETAFMTPGSYILRYTYEGYQVCNVASFDRIITINSRPNPSFTFPGGVTSYQQCENLNTITLNPTPAMGASDRFFMRKDGGAFVPQPLATNVLSLSGAGTYEIYYFYTDLVTGCSNTSTTQVLLLTPLPAISFSGLAPQYCVDATNITLSPTRSNGSITPANGYFSITRVTPAFSLNLAPGVNSFDPSVQLAGVGTYEVRYHYTDENGCSNISAPQSFNLIPLPAPSFTGLGTAYCVSESPATLVGSPAGGTFQVRRVSPTSTAFEIIGSSFNPASPLPSDPLPGSPTLADRNARAGVYQVRYIYTDANGCTGISPVQNVTLNTLPDVDFTFAGGVQEYCVTATAVNLTPTRANGILTPANGFFRVQRASPAFLLNLPNGTNTINPAVDLPGVGSYNVTYHYTDENGCTFASSPKTLIIHPLPNPSFAGLGASYCVSAAPVTLTPLPAAGGTFRIRRVLPTATAFEILPGGVLNPSAPLPSSPLPPTPTINDRNSKAGTYEITYTYTDPNGCTNTSPPQSVVLHELPNVDFLFPGGVSAYCIDYGVITLTPTRSNGGIVSTNGFFTISQGAFSLQLANGQNNLNITTQLTPGAGNYNITYTYLDENNCSYTSSPPRVLTVHPLPTPDISGFATSYCVSAAPVTLIPSPGTGGTFRIRKALPVSEATTFEVLASGVFDPSAPLPSNPLPPSPTLAQRNSKAGVYEITYTYTDGNGCVNISPVKQITVTPLPVIDFDFAGGISAYCVDATNVTLIPSRSNGTIVPASGYFVITRVSPVFSLTLPNGTNNFNPSTQLAGAGTYQVRYYYTDENSCSNVSELKDLIINPLPSLTLTGFVAGTPPAYCVNNADFVINAFNNGNPITIPDPNATFRIRRIAPFVTSFEFFGGTFQPSQPLPSSPLSSNPTIAERNSKAGTYEVSFTFVDGNNCSNTITQQVVVHPIPVLTFTFPFGDKDNYCQDQGNITLNPLLDGNPVANPAQGFFTISKGVFTLTLPNGVNTVNVTTQLFANAGTGDYQVTYTYTNNVTNCTNTSPARTLRINPLPVLAFDFPRPNGIDEDNTYCESATNVTLTPFWLNAGGNPFVAASGFFQFAHQDGTFTYQLPNGVNNLNPSVNLIPPAQTQVKIGIYNVTYHYTDLNGCTNVSPIRELRIYPLPQLNFSFSNVCFGENTNFVANINLPTFDTNDGIVEIKWEFGDGAVQTYSGGSLAAGYSVQHQYVIPITYQVRLTVTTQQGCSNSILKNVRIGAIPVASFTTARFCQGDFVQFTSTSTIAPTDSIATVIWDFGDGNQQTINIYGSLPTILSPNTQHQYVSPGEYEVELTTISTLGCSHSVRKQVFIFPNVVVTPMNPYKENFETSAGGWLPNGSVAGVPKTYSWIHDVPNGVKINASNSTRCWVSKPTSQNAYYDNEQSYVESPCFNISALQRPMIQMKIFYDTDQGGDGVVVQVSRDDGITWEVLGNVGEGIDWYNVTGIAGLPGGQGLKGWSGRSLNNWVLARYPLDAYQGESKLRFRLAFGSNADNLTPAPFDGFAFDEVFIGERNRRVLLEHFTNVTSTTANSENDWIDTQFVGVQNGEAIKIQYHTSFPGADPINANNNADPSARALYYGVSQVPRTSIDGFLRNEAQFSTWGTPEYNKRVLLQSPFSINITYPNNPVELLNISAEITALESIDSSLIVQMVVIEREIPASVFTNVNLGSLTFRNVVKRMLPDAAGTRINQVWQQGSRVVVNQSWNPVNVYDKTKLGVVVFLQNEANKSVYQAFLSNVTTSPSGITSLPTELVQNFVLYPNPTRDKIIVGFEGITISDDYQIYIYDQLGRLCKDGVLKAGNQGVVVDVSSLAEGMYVLKIQNNKGEMLTRKFSVVR